MNLLEWLQVPCMLALFVLSCAVALQHYRKDW